MSVTRYDLTEDLATGEVDITPVPETQAGRYVAYEDYAAMEAKCAALAAENAGLKELIERHANSFAVCPNCSHEDPSETDDIVALYRSMETPATDSFLAEVRAQGVEILAEHLSGMNISASETSVREFAAQLRKGAI